MFSRRFVTAALSLWLVAASGMVEATTVKRAPTQTPPAATRARTVPDEPGGAGGEAFSELYERFYHNYLLGPDDELAIRVLGHPDFSVEKTKVSPVGRVWHPLLGDVKAAGLTIGQLTRYLTDELSEYVINPRVSVSLLEAKSAKIGVLGEIRQPGIIVMARPMTVLDAITAAGGVSDLGSESNVTLLRQRTGGGWVTATVNVKRILQGKAKSEENPTLQAGDTLIVHGNAKKTLATITALTGFSSFLNFVAPGRR
ncbi:MAG TPA: polysaccharide biosynthesis/export family protein [Blastocatellia bacterium]|nr:polysaccharide biosynthesis/export family protein [Blastocatellia bacterium]